MPKNKSLKFSDWFKTLSPSHVVYADFEALTPPTMNSGVDSTTTKVAHHTPAAAGFLVVQRDDMRGPALTQNPLQLFEREDDDSSACMFAFLHALEELVVQVYWWNRQFSHCSANRTADEERRYRTATSCCLCSRTLTSDRHFHHDHLNGKLKGAACPQCNESAVMKRDFLPAFFRNFRGYDAHLLCSTVIGTVLLIGALLFNSWLAVWHNSSSAFHHPLQACHFKPP
jgi:hypothetical protein